MCIETNKIIKSRNVKFMEDYSNIGSHLEMPPSERNGGPIVIMVDESSKFPCIDDKKDLEVNRDVKDEMAIINEPSSTSSLDGSLKMENHPY